MEYNWDNMVSITVPKGLNGWQYSGSVTINGRTCTFPVGVETQVPEPVADYIIRVEKETEANKPKNPNKPVQPDWNQNDETQPDYVKNRTHYDNKQTAICESDKLGEYVTLHNTSFRDPDGESHIGMSTKSWARISNLTPALDILWETGRVQNTGSELTKISEITGWNIMWDTEDFCSIGFTNTRSPYAFLFVVYKAGATLVLGPSNNAMSLYTATAPEPGIYVVVSHTADGYDPAFEYMEWGGIVPLDPKYLPPDITIPSGGSLTIKEGATVNDEAGVLSGGGSGGNSVVFIYDSETEECTCDHTFDEVVAAAEKNVPIILKYTGGSSYGMTPHITETLTKVLIVHAADENGNNFIAAVQAYGLNETNVNYGYTGDIIAEVN